MQLFKSQLMIFLTNETFLQYHLSRKRRNEIKSADSRFKNKISKNQFGIPN